MAEEKAPFVEKPACIGSGVCKMVAPNTFKVEGGKADVIDPHGDSEDKIQAAIDGCPVQAILWKKKA